jgi:UDP-N-acetylmuramate--alanine ligase
MVSDTPSARELAIALRGADGNPPRVHLVGIGGWGMSAIARLLIARGLRVSGSDVKESANIAALRVLGAEISLRHRPSNVDGALAVVTSGAIGDGNPEVVEARKRGMSVLPRAAVLDLLMEGGTSIAVAGTAGKSSTSAMLVRIMRYSGIDVSYAIGAKLRDTGVNAALGCSSMFIAEADESDSSFLLLTPDIAIITNVESDHLDFHGTAGKYREAFECFTDRIPRGGILVTSADDIGARVIARRAAERIQVRTFGETTDSNLRITDIQLDRDGTSYKAILNRDLRFEVRIKQPGWHMAKNAAGALLAAYELGVPMKDAVEALKGYDGVGRRFDFIGYEREVCVYDDFAHSPTKVREQLRAAKALAGKGRLWAVFEAPRVKGERQLADDFVSALRQADVVLLIDEEAARMNMPKTLGADESFWLLDLVAKGLGLSRTSSRVCARREQILAAMREEALPGDVVVTMGERDMADLAAAIIDELRI